ncbi:hypothetical protein M3212_10930 [Alkalihalobacillus oceani]|uniref:hypothetical protein n=1 Tax=Halalkalibacter oceani TaxID=1653776 RepID=UPI00203CDB10|nr:hypothetical protein [Halalkalibacter oceani]MCM3761296.1 hypothetical protein [Halalkalibacter oceani]
MARQIWLLLPAALLFVTIWTLVILQFQQADQSKGSAEDVIVAEKGEAVDQRNEQIRTDVVEEGANPDTDARDADEDGVSEEGTINLTEFDFNDISTPAGVPIDVILSKLHLD